MNNRQQGTLYEQFAAEYLCEHQIKILERNYRCRFGEIDIIGRDGKYLVFFEVKQRTGASHGDPKSAVGLKKQKTISKVSDYYRMEHQLTEDIFMRFDVIAICNNQVEWICNAFPYIH